MLSNSLYDKTIVHIAPGQWAKHMRIYHRQCLDLAKRGYKLDLVAHEVTGEEMDPRVRFHSLGTLGKTNLAWNVSKRFRRCWESYEIALNSKAHLYHFHSPEFIWWAARLREKTGRPIIFDCMEDFEGYALQRRGIPGFLRRPLAYMVKRQLAYAGKKLDAIIVSDQGTGRLLAPYAQRVVLIHNFPKISLFQVNGYSLREKPYDIVYHGSIPKYHLQAILSIDSILVKRGHKVRWRLIGRIPEMDWFTRELHGRGISERFFVSGLIPHDEVASELVKAKLGIIPLPNLPKFQNNIPQKLFEFMALGMPVVLSDLPPSRPFVEHGVSAFMVPPDDYEAYAGAILELLQRPDLCRRMGHEGRQRVLHDYNWEKESQKLFTLYEELIHQ